MNKIESFKTFSQLQSQLREEARQKELASKREASVAEFNELLSKYNASSIEDLNEEDREAFMKELTKEGNAFGAARAKAIAKGEDKFEVDGEEFDVENVDKEDEENAEEFVEEARNLNDPIAMKLRADKAKRDIKKEEPAATKMSSAKDKKLAQLKAKRAQIMRDMEQEAEMDGGPIADRYGAMLNKIDKEIAKLSGKKEKGYKLMGESEIKSAEEFADYAETVLRKAFGEDYDEAKAKETVDGILSKVDGDFGAAVGMLTKSLGESVVAEARDWGTYGTPEAKKVIKDMDKTWDKFSKTVSKAHGDFRSDVKTIINSEDGSKSGIIDSEGAAYIAGMIEQFVKKEFMIDKYGDISRYDYMNDLYESNQLSEKKADGTISDDEDERRADLLARVKKQMEDLLASAEAEANDIGGSFRAPGIMAEIRKELDRQVKKFK